MSRLVRIILAGLILAAAPALAQDEELYKPIDVRELPKNITKYWAVGIVFKDTLVAPPSGSTVTISGKKYVKFSTKFAGECYIESGILGSQPKFVAGNDYLFSGTVLQKPSGWFSSGSKYLVSVTRVMPALKNISDIGEMLKQVARDKNNPDIITLLRMNEMYAGLQSDIAARAQNQDVAMSEMFKPDTTNRLEVQYMVSQALSSMAQQTKLTPEDLLAQYVLALLAVRYPPSADAEPEPAAEIEEQPDAIVEPRVEEAPEEIIKPLPKPVKEEPSKPAEKKPVKNETAPLLKPRLRASPPESTMTSPPPVDTYLPEPAEETKAVEEPVPAPVVESEPAPAPVIEPPPETPPRAAPAPVLPEVNPAHIEATLKQMEEPKPEPAPRPAPKKKQAAKPAATPPAVTTPMPAPAEEDYNAPVPL